MDRWALARRVLENKMCGARRRGESCNHASCIEAENLVMELRAGRFSARAREVIRNKLCSAAKRGEDCGHPGCREVIQVLSLF